MDVELDMIAAAEEKRKEIEGERGAKSGVTKGDEEATNDYSPLNQPTENIYSEALALRTPIMYDKDDYKRIRLYRGISVALLFLCLILLIVVAVMGTKLNSQPECAAKMTSVSGTCSPETCRTIYPLEKTCKRYCSTCERGWLKHEGSCYYLSERTLSWDMSRKECQRKGGDLVVIGNQTVQTFLSSRAKLTYWIGLSHEGSGPWTWINGTPLSESFWAPEKAQQGGCALLEKSQSEKNWRVSHCASNTYYICQKTV
ncbi:early activation antigen CD69 isoform X2 [Chanos chanos]|uniref:Early activation antigen CD69 isoform X2 n=1 Tax=Chanos chanos TaxID=29144 RepID=A0A6J2W533_CHACN|nr:early activation antigen CD69-like isoform X2 [Chanos chanos]